MWQLVINILLSFLISSQTVMPASPTGSLPPIRLWQNNSLGIKTTAKSEVIIDKDSAQILYRKNENEQTPIASLTKLMTALVLLETNPDFNSEIGMIKEDDVSGGQKYIRPGERASFNDFWHDALIASANNAVNSLVRSTGLTKEEFVAKMNQKASDLGLVKTKFTDPTGLDVGDVSTAKEYATIAQLAFSEPRISQILTLPDYQLTITNKDIKRKIFNTNKLLTSFLEITGGKTGFTEEAGYCLALQVQNEQAKEIIIVSLGAASQDDRFQEAKSLAVWTFENYRWP